LFEDARLICVDCAAEYSADEPIWRCRCGGMLDLRFVSRFDPAEVARRRPTMWRYREAIPIRDDANIVSMDEGFTPLIPREIAGRSILVKQEQLFQTGSYKDRGASVLISKAKELGVRRVVEDSSGNAGCAIAAYCAAAHIECHIYVPADTSPAKLAQIVAYGAELHLVPGSRSDTARAVLEAAESEYYASHSWNPFFFQGTKTIAYEIYEQLDGQRPDAVVLPVGNGTLLLGAAIGFAELRDAGLIDRLPRLIAVQAERCAPLAARFVEQPVVEPQPTLAEGIAIADPIRGPQILDAVVQTGGCFITVTEDEIVEALKQTARAAQYLVPSSAATLAEVARYIETQNPPEDATIVSVYTGHGLKSTEKMMRLFGS